MPQIGMRKVYYRALYLSPVIGQETGGDFSLPPIINGLPNCPPPPGGEGTEERFGRVLGGWASFFHPFANHLPKLGCVVVPVNGSSVLYHGFQELFLRVGRKGHRALVVAWIVPTIDVFSRHGPYSFHQSAVPLWGKRRMVFALRSFPCLSNIFSLMDRASGLEDFFRDTVSFRTLSLTRFQGKT